MLKYIQDHLPVPAANYIVSIWDGYLDKEQILKERCTTNGIMMPYIHSSGHADCESLRKIADHVNPSRIIPIHTEHKDLYYVCNLLHYLMIMNRSTLHNNEGTGS